MSLATIMHLLAVSVVPLFFPGPQCGLMYALYCAVVTASEEVRDQVYLRVLEVDTSCTPTQ